VCEREREKKKVGRTMGEMDNGGQSSRESVLAGVLPVCKIVT
jgi:hypothetical protein